MRRTSSIVRDDLNTQVANAGFVFAQADNGDAYWDESIRYEFTLDEIEQRIEAPTNELHALCMHLVDMAAKDERLLQRLRIPETLYDHIANSWRYNDPSLYGRFDLVLAADGTTKMLELNADTPTSLFEAAVFQWTWLEQKIAAGELPEDADQFNSIHDKLVARWPRVARGDRVHFAGLDAPEDAGTLSYLHSTALAGRVNAQTPMQMEDIDITPDGRRFLDRDNQPIDCLFKLYPWEWLVADANGQTPAMRQTRFVEPAWKAILSTKAILPVLWEIEPGHPNLLPARFNDDYSRTVDIGSSYVRKPIYSREGGNVDVIQDEKIIERTGGTYGGDSIVQQFCSLPEIDGARSIVGSWVVGDQACGANIREGRGRIITNQDRFVPHVIID